LIYIEFELIKMDKQVNLYALEIKNNQFN